MWTIIGAVCAAILTSQVARKWKNRDGVGTAMVAALVAIMVGALGSCSVAVTDPSMADDSGLGFAIFLTSFIFGSGAGFLFVALMKPEK